MKARIERWSDMVEDRVAVFSDCDRYRFALSIVWGVSKPRLVVVLLNPSTATHLQNDPTVARCCERARRMGLGGLEVLNAFAWRETDRLKMLKVADPVGELNDRMIRDAMRRASSMGSTVLVGWGNEGGHRGRSDEVAAIIAEVGIEAKCLRICANGQPGHPLYIGYDAPLLPWPQRSAA